MDAERASLEHLPEAEGGCFTLSAGVGKKGPPDQLRQTFLSQNVSIAPSSGTLANSVHSPCPLAASDLER